VSLQILIYAVVGLLPIMCLLAALLYFDSYKLVKPRTVIAVIGCGILVAGLSLVANIFAIEHLAIDFTMFTRYIGPVIEAKAGLRRAGCDVMETLYPALWGGAR